jgi:multimeric flavodoxin WrbA
MTLNVLALNCTLKKSSGEPSSTDDLLEQVLEELGKYDAQGEIVRICDFNIKPGVSSDEGDGDDWPQIRKKVLASNILILGTPIWLGQPSSICKRVLERMDAFLSETDDQGRMVSYGRVAGVAVVGNEDGAHHVCAELFQALSDVGFTIPASAATYWVGAAMQKVNYKDLRFTPKEVVAATATLARNSAHLAKLLKENQYPGEG